MAKFTSGEWQKIVTLADQSAEDFGLPLRRQKSVVIGTFNIRVLGRVESRSTQAWDFLVRICQRFDLLAIQEVQDNLAGLRELHRRLGTDFGLVVSDATGAFPGDRGSERLAFLFNWKRVERTELASDISYDRTKVAQTLFENRADFRAAWDNHLRRLAVHEERVRVARLAGKRGPNRPPIRLPRFLTFIRQPLCASFRILPRPDTVEPIEFLAINAHLLYGDNPQERLFEFEALIEWLTIRAKQPNRMFPSLMLLGDLNLEFAANDVKRAEIEEQLKRINETKLTSQAAAKVNFPLLDDHPDPSRNPLRTNARQDQTYDQIAIFVGDPRLPDHDQNPTAGATADGYDYGVFKFTDLFAMALHGASLADLNATERHAIIDKTDNDVSDHMPAWIRLPIPGV